MSLPFLTGDLTYLRVDKDRKDNCRSQPMVDCVSEVAGDKIRDTEPVAQSVRKPPELPLQGRRAGGKKPHRRCIYGEVC